MSMIENFNKRIPEYYNAMFLDGYTPNEILIAMHKKIRRELEERNKVDKITITSEVRVR